jgi:hypothetical protein
MCGPRTGPAKSARSIVERTPTAPRCTSSQRSAPRSNAAGRRRPPRDAVRRPRRRRRPGRKRHTGEGRRRLVDPVRQAGNLRAVVGILVGQHRRVDVAGVGVRGEVEFAPRVTPPCPMLLGQPLAGPAKPQAGTVYQQVRWSLAARWPRHLQRLGPSAQGAVVGHGQIEAEQAEYGADEALGLAQCQAEYCPQGQGRRYRQGGSSAAAHPGRCAAQLSRLRSPLR